MRESVIYQEIYQEGNLKGRLEGKLEGIQQGEITLMMKLLKRRFGNVNQNLQNKITRLSIIQLEDLGESLLDFESINDLIEWLNNRGN